MVGLDERNEQCAPVDDAMQDVRDIYEAEHVRLWRSLYAFSRSGDVADEAVAEAFAQLLRRAEE